MGSEKTLGSEGPPVVNVNGPRYGVVHGADRRVLGLNNIELITDRDLFVNLEEIKRVKAVVFTNSLVGPVFRVGLAEFPVLVLFHQ